MTVSSPVVRRGERPAGAARSPRGSSSQQPANKRLQNRGLPWILPAAILVCGLIYYSIGYTGYSATLDWDGISPNPKSVGLANFSKMLSDPIFRKALIHTAIYLVGTFVPITFIAFTVAAILHTKVILPTIYKVIIFIPAILAPATMAPAFRQFFDAKGMVNSILRSIGLDSLAHSWLGDPKTSLATIIVISIWHGTGISFILFYAAMSQIEPELLEAARLDGAGNIRTLWYIVWPGCRGTVVALAMLSTIGALKTFDWPWLVTIGGPSYSSEFLGTMIYRRGIQQSQIGYSAALSIALLVLAIGGAILASRTNRNSAR